MNKTVLGNLLGRANAVQGLGAILAPITNKVQELRDFSASCTYKANALREQMNVLQVQADILDSDAVEAARIADNLEDAVL